MSDHYQINGHLALKLDFEEFAARLKQAAGDSWRPEIVSDKDISHEELLALLDCGRDGNLTAADFLKNPAIVLHDDVADGLLIRLTYDGFENLRRFEGLRDSLSPIKLNGRTDWFRSVIAKRGITDASVLRDEDIDYLTMAVVKNFNLLPLIPPRYQRAVWNRALQMVRKDGVAFDPARVATQADLVRTLGEHGINFTKRIRSLSTALTLTGERDSLDRKPDNRPIALLFYTTKDRNDAFETVPVVDRFVESGKFRVLYYEVSTEGEERRIRAEVTSRTGRKIHTLAYGGHGNSKSLALGDDHGFDPLRSNEKYFVDTVDFDEGDFNELASQMDEHGQVLLDACSNGEGGDENDNLTNRFAEALPGRRIFSSKVPTNMLDFFINDDLSIYVSWSARSPYEARAAEGSLPRWTSLYRSGFQTGAQALYQLGIKNADAPGDVLFFNDVSGVRIWEGYRFAQYIGLRAALDMERVRTSNAPTPSDTMIDASVGVFLQPTPDYKGGRSLFSFTFMLPEIGYFRMMGQDVSGLSIASPGAQLGISLSDRIMLEGFGRFKFYKTFGMSDHGNLGGPQFGLGLTYHTGEVEWERAGSK